MILVLFFSVGEISVEKQLDREREPEYRLEVRASDGTHSSTAVARITVTDVNDEHPTFSEPWYSFSVLEDARTGRCYTSCTVKPVIYDTFIGRPHIILR